MRHTHSHIAITLAASLLIALAATACLRAPEALVVDAPLVVPDPIAVASGETTATKLSAVEAIPVRRQNTTEGLGRAPAVPASIAGGTVTSGMEHPLAGLIGTTRDSADRELEEDDWGGDAVPVATSSGAGRTHVRHERQAPADLDPGYSPPPVANATPAPRGRDDRYAPPVPPATHQPIGTDPGYSPAPPLAQRVAPAPTEHYTPYGVNGFVDPRVDALSTFAIDVDTASYTITRRKLRDGYLPPAAAVRTEEFVNSFPYTYRQPDAGSPFAVDFEITPSPFTPNNHIVRVGVQGRQISDAQRRPAHLTFLVDVSGSMRSTDKLDLVKRSLLMLTDELEDGDTVAVATYAGSTRVVLPPTPVGHRADIVSALDGLTAGGSTSMGSGIEMAYRLAEETFQRRDINRIIVASDGDANVGQTSHTELSRVIRGYADRGITLTTLGFGSGNYQDTMMERLADDGDGNYYYIDSLAESRRVLVENLNGTLEVIAKDVKIQVDWDPTQVLAYRLIGYENRDVADHAFRDDAVDGGEIGAGHQVTALYEVALADHARGNLATVRIRNKAPGPDSPAVERSFDLDAKTMRDSFADASDQTRIAVAASAFAEILRGSPHLGETTLRDVLAIAQSAQRVEHREDAELVELIDRASKLRGEGAFVQR